MSDARIAMARQHHRQAAEALEVAARHRDLRDDTIRRLRAEDPDRWSYKALAAAVGCSPELIAVIVRQGSDAADAGTRRRGRPPKRGR